MNIYKILITFLLVFGTLLGCAQGEPAPNTETNNNEEEQVNESVVVTISQEEEILTEKEIAVEEGSLLLDVMKENFDIEETGGFITSIEGVSQDDEAGKYWLYTVNGEMPSVGAAELELQAGDSVSFNLSTVE